MDSWYVPGMKTRLTGIILATLFLAPCMNAEENPWKPWGNGHLTFYLDNDLFAGADGNYTNGARLSWVSGENSAAQANFLQRGIQKLNGDLHSWEVFRDLWGFKNPDKVRYQYGVALTQLIYTPDDFLALEAPDGQRPYAGWTGLGFSVHTKDDRALNSVELVFGVIGPHSYAETTQDFVHSVRDIDKFNGWDSQIPDELTANIYFMQRRRLPFLESGDHSQFSIDGNSEVGMSLGNFRTDLRLGFLTRIGWNLPVEFSDPRLSETANTQRLFTSSGDEGSHWSVYFVGGGRVNLVGHDATLDGPVFRDFDTGVSSKWLVGEVYAGMGVRYQSWEVSYMHTFRTREFSGQEASTSFGSVAIRYEF